MNAVKKRYGIKKTDKETLRRWYYLLYLGRLLDEKAPSYLLQSIGWQFHASNAGHDGIQLAIGQTFQRGKDHHFGSRNDGSGQEHTLQLSTTE